MLETEAYLYDCKTFIVRAARIDVIKHTFEHFFPLHNNLLYFTLVNVITLV
jgi:hypothetical protein